MMYLLYPVSCVFSQSKDRKPESLTSWALTVLHPIREKTIFDIEKVSLTVLHPIREKTIFDIEKVSLAVSLKVIHLQRLARPLQISCRRGSTIQVDEHDPSIGWSREMFNLGGRWGVTSLWVRWHLALDSNGSPRWERNGGWAECWRYRTVNGKQIGGGVELRRGQLISKDMAVALHKALCERLDRRGKRLSSYKMRRARFVAVSGVTSSSSRVITRGDHVHHKNRNTQDDRLCNLETLSAQDHAALHQREGDPLTYGITLSLDLPKTIKRYRRVANTLNFVRGVVTYSQDLCQLESS